MPEKDYPIGMYKAGEDQPQYAHSQKDEKTLQQDGYTEGASSIGAMEYPKMLYNKTGGTIIAETKQDEQKLAAQGYSDKVTVPDEIPHARDRQPGDRSRIDDLEDAIEQLKEQLAHAEQGGEPQTPQRPGGKR